MPDFNELSDLQRRCLVDVRQAYDAYIECNRQYKRNYAGSMRWITRSGRDYLSRRHGRAEISLGPRSPETEAAYEAFMSGRSRLSQRAETLIQSLKGQAAQARAAGLGRVPRLTASLLRRLDDAGVLGHIRIVGTNALYAYEALAAVVISGDALATRDVDLLVDARRRLRILTPNEDERSLMTVLRSVDKTFDLQRDGAFRAVNDEGFMVDLIRPQTDPPYKNEPGSSQLADGDLTPVAIAGLQWLANSPRVDAIVVDDLGQPAPMISPDPRIWMTHKLWLSGREDRDSEKRGRDRRQAFLARDILTRHLPQFPFNAAWIAGAPTALRAAATELLPPPSDDKNNDDDAFPTPGW